MNFKKERVSACENHDVKGSTETESKKNTLNDSKGAISQGSISKNIFQVQSLDFESFYDFKPSEYLIHNLLPQEKVGMLHGDPGIGKSALILRIIISICCNIPFYGRKVKHGKCLYLSFEDSKNRIIERMKYLCINEGVDFNDDIRATCYLISHYC